MATVSLSLRDYQSDAGITKWVSAVGVTSAPIPRANIRTALRFFCQRMPKLPTDMAANFLRAMDLSRAVRELTLQPDEEVIAFRMGTESPFKLFYMRPGGSKFNSGINPAGRSIVRFSVRVPAPALESYTSGTIDVWTTLAEGQPTTVAPRANSTGVMALAGGLQLLIPNSFAVLTVIS